MARPRLQFEFEYELKRALAALGEIGELYQKDSKCSASLISLEAGSFKLFIQAPHTSFVAVSCDCGRGNWGGRPRMCLRGSPQTDAAGVSVQAIGVECRRRQDQDIKRIY